jgi:hypothetical protein
MKPKVPAAIITGTMARPSSPSVRFTELPAPTTTKAVTTGNRMPSGIIHSFRNGNAKPLAIEGGLTCMIAAQAASAMTISRPRRALLEKPLCDCFVTLRKSS